MLVSAWVAMAPTPASTWGTRLPTAGTAVETQAPSVNVFGHLATIEKVVKLSLLNQVCVPLKLLRTEVDIVIYSMERAL